MGNQQEVSAAGQLRLMTAQHHAAQRNTPPIPQHIAAYQVHQFLITSQADKEHVFKMKFSSLLCILNDQKRVSLQVIHTPNV